MSIKKFLNIPFHNVVKEGVTLTQLDYSNKVVKDGKHNDFPQYLFDIVGKSPTASACIKRICDFITGSGLHEDIKDIPIDDKGNTFWDLHRAVAMDYAYYNRVSIELQAARNGKIIKATNTPAEWVRFSMNEDINDPNYYFAKVNPYVDTTQENWQSEQIQVLQLYEGADSMSAQIRDLKDSYQGHLLYHNDTRPGARIYSRPEWFSAERAIITDGRIWAFHDRNTANNFFLGGILSVLADPDAGVGETNSDGEYYETFADVFERQMNQKFAGVEQGGSMMVFYKTSEADPDPQIIAPPTNTFDNTFTNLLNDTVNTITAAIGVPKVLLPQEITGKLGTSQEIRNAILFMNQTTQAARQTLEKLYRQILEGMNIAYNEDEAIIYPLKDFTDLPDAIFNSLSQNQKDAYIQETFGIEPDEEAQSEMETEEEETIQEIIFNKINGNGNN